MTHVPVCPMGTLTCRLNSSSFSIHMYSANGSSSGTRFRTSSVLMVVVSRLSLGSLMSLVSDVRHKDTVRPAEHLLRSVWVAVMAADRPTFSGR